MPCVFPFARLTVSLACLVVFAALIAAACAPRASSRAASSSEASTGDATAAAPADTLLSLERSPCFGTCPSYALTVFTDGRVVYAGRRYVEVEDTVRTQIPEADVQRLAEQFRAADYFAYERSYTSEPECPVRMTDFPTVRTAFWGEGGRPHQVQHYHGCFARDGGPGSGPERPDRLARLAALEDTVDAIVGTARWTGVEE